MTNRQNLHRKVGTPAVQLCILEGLVEEHNVGHRLLVGLRRGRILGKSLDTMPH